MGKTKDTLVMVNFSRGDYKLLCEKHSHYADLQGEMVTYATWCEIMDYLKKMSGKKDKRSNRIANIAMQTEIVSVD